MSFTSFYLLEDIKIERNKDAIDFPGKVVIIGYGAIARVTLPILLKHVNISPKDITIIEMEDKQDQAKSWTDLGVTFLQKKITEDNLEDILGSLLNEGDLLIDVAYDIGCTDIVNFCHNNKVLYCNTSIEKWDPYKDMEKMSTYEKSLYYRHMELQKLYKTWDSGNRGTTAVLDHGANPGLISHLTKQGLIDIAVKQLNEKQDKNIRKALEEKDFATLSMLLGVKVIHCSERDTQISNEPKKVDEFVGTWSISGLREEGMSCSELGWGTHEEQLSIQHENPKVGPLNQIFLNQMGINTLVRSFVPSGEILGMLIRHGEAYGISKNLTVEKNGKVIYRPTVHYSYVPCDATIASLQEFRSRMYKEGKYKRVMYDDIQVGHDELGALIMGHKYNSWWTGTILEIEEARKLVLGKNTTNATNIQVAISLVACITWMIKNPNEGVKLPDDLPHDYILDICKPYLGKYVSGPFNWSPKTNFINYFPSNTENKINDKNLWSFENFLFRP